MMSESEWNVDEELVVPKKKLNDSRGGERRSEKFE
jgi:hypothetical protein